MRSNSSPTQHPSDHSLDVIRHAATGEAEDPESGEQPFADRWADGGDRTRSAAHAAPDRDPNGH